MSEVNNDDFLILGGDFNCNDSGMDRNHVEPHMQSRKRLFQLIKSNSIIDVWRNFHATQKQYTWAHAHHNQISLARLDRFYIFKHQLSMFRECHGLWVPCPILALSCGCVCVCVSRCLWVCD